MNKKILFTLLLVASFVISCFVGSGKVVMAAPSGEPLRIGLAVALTSDYGKTMLGGAKLAIKEVNEAGGILGRPLKLYTADTEFKADKAATAVLKLVKVNKCDFLIGMYSSEEGIGGREAAMDLKKILFLCGCATHRNPVAVIENYKRYKYLFGVGTIDEWDEAAYSAGVQAPFLAGVLKKKLGVEKVKVAVISDAAAWTEASHKIQLAQLPLAGLEVVYKARTGVKQIDFSVEFSEIRKRGVHLIMLMHAYPSTLPFVKQWYDLKVPALLAGLNVRGMSPAFWEETGGKCVYLINYNWGSAPPGVINELTGKFWEAQMAEFGKTYFCAGAPYNSIYALKHAIEAAGTTDADAVVKALEKVRFVGIGGNFSFRDDHRPKIGPDDYMVYTYQYNTEGKWNYLLPREIATAEVLFPPWMKKN